ncbi:hypothetical protein IQ06DRAFT_294868 [Phaeosphaeriaceae sp. SRC1lsM3a]|nr:hypothetical protein IQ06DRAFT_294868 [Stagonospora sp. SRC1lsM3a]
MQAMACDAAKCSVHTSFLARRKYESELGTEQGSSCLYVGAIPNSFSASAPIRSNRPTFYCASVSIFQIYIFSHADEDRTPSCPDPLRTSPICTSMFCLAVFFRVVFLCPLRALLAAFIQPFTLCKQAF